MQLAGPPLAGLCEKLDSAAAGNRLLQVLTTLSAAGNSANIETPGQGHRPAPSQATDSTCGGRRWSTAPHPMFTMMVFLWVKCSSIASSEASLPRPLLLTPP